MALATVRFEAKECQLIVNGEFVQGTKNVYLRSDVSRKSSCAGLEVRLHAVLRSEWVACSREMLVADPSLL